MHNVDMNTFIEVVTPLQPDANQTLSVVICCYTADRWDDLCEAVESVELQELRVDQIVIVVDHNRDLLARLLDRFPNCLIIENTGERGLSGARNAGIAASTGDVIGFLDDDAVAAPDMFRRLTRHLQESDVLGAVANIQPHWLGQAADWFPAEFYWVVGCTYHGMALGRVRNLLGAAMCVKRSVFLSAGGFNSGLGRNHSALPLGCEETEFCIRANRVHPGGHFRYEGQAICSHKVPTRRVTWTYLLHRCYAEGWSKAHVAFIAQASGSLNSERVYVTRTVPLAIVRGLAAFVMGERAGLGRAVAGVMGLTAAALGYARGRLTLAADPKRALALRELPAMLAID